MSTSSIPEKPTPASDDVRTDEELVNKLVAMQSAPFSNVMSMWGRSTGFKLVHNELDKRGYTGKRPSRLLNSIRENTILDLLYSCDPLGIGCETKESRKKYQAMAARIIKKMHNNKRFKVAANEVLIDVFDDELVLNTIVTELLHKLVGMK